MNNLPNLSDFKVFCVVAKRRSFVESAEELGASPAYISKRINILETNLNCKLFHRSTRHVSLTEDGKLILDKATHILEEFDALSELVNNPLVQQDILWRVLLTLPVSLLFWHAPALILGRGGRADGEALRSVHSSFGKSAFSFHGFML